MHGLADGRRVTLVSDPTQDRVDQYGRLLDYVFRGHEDLGKVQLRRGWADVYVYNHRSLREGEAVQPRRAPSRERRPRGLEGLRRRLPHAAVAASPEEALLVVGLEVCHLGTGVAEPSA